MPQMNKGGKYIFGMSVIRNDGSVQFPTQAVEEYHIANEGKAGYTVHVLSDCITSYDKKKLPEMLNYYAQKGCIVESLSEVRI